MYRKVAEYLECGIFAHCFAQAWVVVTVGTTTLSPLPVHRAAHGGDGGAPDRSRLPALGGARADDVCAQATALLYAA